ncbi:cation:proton antiporter [Planctomyces sp. SH-PL14]|uniref:cation:proton antiporter n=1 Tax=Planctomyces sp. SH-PL14 TaxID=1632864 RepID=UPI0018D4BDE3|nr:cation:proton antiporter [Planctomyces sp. SH-PL14]
MLATTGPRRSSILFFSLLLSFAMLAGRFTSGQEAPPSAPQASPTSPSSDGSSEAAPSSTEASPSAPPVDAAGHDEQGAEHGSEGHTDPVTPVLLGIVLLLLSAKLAGDLFDRIGLPAVLGELFVGILIGNMEFLSGWGGFEFLKAGETFSHLDILARIGVVLLLFEVGLESTVKGMMSVGVTAFIVACLGVVAPMILGFLVGYFALPGADWKVHLFLGATLSATSVGITARVLKDLGRSQQTESQIILGAAVIDDVLGLIVLAVVQGIVRSGSADLGGIAIIVLKAFGFLAGAVLIGTHLVAKPAFKAATYLRGHGLLVTTALCICFLFAWLASLMGLAPIVGAFAAGLILEEVQYHSLSRKENVALDHALKPIGSLLIPLFFVQIGVHVDLSAFNNPTMWTLAIALTFVAILGKQVCALGVSDKTLDRLSIGIGMIPRGEVGLIFASEGAKLMYEGKPVVDSTTYTALVFMVMATTIITPPLLKWSMNRKRAEASPPATVA